MLASLTRLFFWIMVLITGFLGWFCGVYPPNFADLTILGSVGAFIGMLLIMTAPPTVMTYFRYKARLDKYGIHKPFWKSVQFAAYGSYMSGITTYVYVATNAVAIGYIAASFLVTIACYLMFAQALYKFDQSLNDRSSSM